MNKGVLPLITGIIGAVLPVLWADYHNQHVNLLSGANQFYIEPRGFLYLALAGFFVGLVIGLALISNKKEK